MEPKAAPGNPWEVKSRWEIYPKAPREIAIQFFRTRGAPDVFWEPPGEAPGAHLAPKRAPEASRSHLGTILGAKKEPRGFIFEASFGQALATKGLADKGGRRCWRSHDQ